MQTTPSGNAARKRESGQAIVLLTMMMIALVAILGLAVDGGGLYFLHRDTQNAVDAALVAAAYAKCTSDPSDANYDQRIIDAARNAAESNGFENGAGGTVVDVETDYTPPVASSGTYVRVAITAQKPAYFIQILAPQTLQVTSAGVALCDPSNINILPPAAVITVRADNGCSSSPGSMAFNYGGTSALTVHDSGVWVNSANASCAIRNHGGGDIVVDEACMVIGGVSGSPDCGVEQFNMGAANQISQHPLEDMDPPDGACGLTAQTHSGSGTINPGHYSSISVGNHNTLTMNPGLYCVDNFDYSKGTLLGNGVVIYMPPGNPGFHANAQSTLSIAAPTADNCISGGETVNTCDWIGLLIWSDPDLTDSDHTEIHLNGGAATATQGMIYAPDNICTLEGGADSEMVGVFVCYGLRGEGNSELDIWYEKPQFLNTPPRVSIAE